MHSPEGASRLHAVHQTRDAKEASPGCHRQRTSGVRKLGDMSGASSKQLHVAMQHTALHVRMADHAAQPRI